MISNVDAVAERFLNDINTHRMRSDRAQRQLSSGRRIDRPSDSPNEIKDVLQLQADIARVEQVIANLAQSRVEARAADEALGRGIKLVERAITLASQGAGSIRTASERATSAGEVESVLEQMVGVSRTIVNGRFIFSGDRETSPAYESDPTAANGVGALQATESTRVLRDANGVDFRVSLGAEEIFDARDASGAPLQKNVFQALNDLKAALTADDGAAIDSALLALRASHEHLNRQQGFYGVVQRRIDEAEEAARSSQLSRQSALSERRDADLPAAIMALEQSKLQLEASLGARAQRPRTSLFDYLG